MPSSRALARRHARARRARGAVLSEAVIVIIFLMLVFGCASDVHRLHAEKLRASRRVREAAWTQVMAACPADGGGEAVVTNLRPDTERLFGSIAGIELLQAPVSHTRQERAAQLTPGRSVGLPATQVRSVSLLTCNERPLDIDPRSSGELAWHSLTGW